MLQHLSKQFCRMCELTVVLNQLADELLLAELP